MVDECLLFDLMSAPLLFTAMADLLQWMMGRRGVTLSGIIYVDDFITLEQAGKVECERNF